MISVTAKFTAEIIKGCTLFCYIIFIITLATINFCPLSLVNISVLAVETVRLYVVAALDKLCSTFWRE
jgi:hypothetical protein